MDDLIIIDNKIYEIRGQKVMLDFDLAEMYEIETIRRALLRLRKAECCNTSEKHSDGQNRNKRIQKRE